MEVHARRSEKITLPALVCHACEKPITVLVDSFHQEGLRDLEVLQSLKVSEHSPLGLDLCVDCVRLALCKMTILRHGDSCGVEPKSNTLDPVGHTYRMQDYITNTLKQRDTA